MVNIIKRSWIWRRIRLFKIVRKHQSVANVCKRLIYESSCIEHKEDLNFSTKAIGDKSQIIWQYWAQGYDKIPEVVSKCLKSVEEWKEDYILIRLNDNNLSEYINLPNYILEKKEKGIIPLAQFSDILRVCLLSVYGGVWLDATILLTGPIPKRYKEIDFFAYQRDPNEPNQKYWENAYAYYYGWSNGFKVNMLNAVIFANKDSVVVKEIALLLLSYWKNNDRLPDYFFFQILFDTLINGTLKGHNCPIESDCTPHLLQQSINDPKFNLYTKVEILKKTSIHKMTYK